MQNFEFHSPLFLGLFLLFIPLIIRDLIRKRKTTLKLSTTNGLTPNRGVRLVFVALSLTKYFILLGLIIAMARPRTFTVLKERDDTKGVDIMLSVDVSLSMLAKDLEPDRLEALKKIARDFVKKRPNDRIGLVTYSGEAVTKVPVTFDHQVLDTELAHLDPMELESGTSIGDGLAVAVSHLKDSKAKSKIIIQMTDGVNTIQNGIPPMVASELAKSSGIKVYTIGIGTNGYALMPTEVDMFGDLIFSETEVKIDDKVLSDIARMTGGKYFRATSNDSLEKVYSEIDRLEKSKLRAQTNYQYQEFFGQFLWFSLLVLLFDALLRWIVFKRIV